MPDELNALLTKFAREKTFRSKGPLGVALVVTDHAKTLGLPLDSESLLTGKGGQVRGLGKSAVQTILARHGISRVLAKEAGRTSRGSIEKMRDYVAFLNALHEKGQEDLDSIELFWIARVRDYFAGQPFRIKLDASRSLMTVIRDIIDQAEARQREASGTQYAGAVLQHLVGAKLELVTGANKLKHHSFSTSDAQHGRDGDFVIEDVAIHVTTSPGEAVIERCRENLDDGCRPLVVTTKRGVPIAQGLADNRGLGDRIDIFDIEQFIAFNVYERGLFAAAGRRATVAKIVERYNEIIDSVETDPSLQIAWKK